MPVAFHADRPKFLARLAAMGRTRDAAFDGDLYRFINPKYAKAVDIISGAGARHAAGRWNLTGGAALSYTALVPETALAEALANVRYYHLPTSKAMPRVLVALRLKVSRVLDLRDGRLRKALVLSEDTIRNVDWRAENQQGREAVTQAWGSTISLCGFEAAIVPSSADDGGANVLVYPENLLAGSTFAVKDEVKWI